jgi:hypothetical protein
MGPDFFARPAVRFLFVLGTSLMNDILMKVVAASTPREVIALVKTVILTRLETFEIISALAQRQRYPGENPERAFTRFVTRDPDGIELNQLLRAMPGSKAIVAEFARLPQTKSSEELGNLNTRSNTKMLNGRRLRHYS